MTTVSIAERMRSLIPLLKAGINGISFKEVRPSCEDEWGDDYAIVCDAYHDEDTFYFDEDAFMSDLRELLAKHFTSPGEVVFVFSDKGTKPPPGVLAVGLYLRTNEIEAYRTKRGKA